jgi:hypothetical protein
MDSWQTNHGISLSKDGKMLFVSNLNQVRVYDYDAATGKATNPRTLVTGMQNNGPHPTRAILISKFDPDKLLVAVGSNANIDTGSVSESSGRCMIKVFSVSETIKQTANYATGGKIVGWGLRNIVGIGEDPAYGGIVGPVSSLSFSSLCSNPIFSNPIFAHPPLFPPSTLTADSLMKSIKSGPSKTPWTTSASAVRTFTMKTRQRS